MNQPIDDAIVCKMRDDPEQFTQDDDHDLNVGDGVFIGRTNPAGEHRHVGGASVGGFAFWHDSVDQTERIMARRLAG